MRSSIRCAVVALTLSVAALTQQARAQSDDDKSTARTLGQDGQEALDKKNFSKASDLFRRAVKIFDEAKAPVPPTLLLGYARGSAGKGNVVAAQEAYNRVIRQGTAPGASALFANAVEDAKKEIDAVSARIASVTITVSGCDNPQVTVDDNPISSAVLGIKKSIDPGTHIVKATAASCSSGEASFEVGDGKSAEVSVKLKKDDKDTGMGTVTGTPTPTGTGPATGVGTGADTAGSKGGGPNMALAITGFAVGGVGLVLGGITGALALGKHSTLSTSCPSGVNCASKLQSDLDSYHLMGTLSTVGFIVGGVGIVAGVIFLATAPSSPKKSAWIMPVIGPGSLGAVGAF